MSSGPTITASFIFAIALIAVLVLARWMSRGWSYRCPDCGELFQVSILGQFAAINMGDERSVRCPHCHKRNWVKTLRKT